VRQWIQPTPILDGMSTSGATTLARQVVADLSEADVATKRLGAFLLLMADEIDRLAGVDRLARQVR
jgi:tRNA uridine 5-carbamoylmethylation protein Kti12